MSSFFWLLLCVVPPLPRCLRLLVGPAFNRPPWSRKGSLRGRGSQADTLSVRGGQPLDGLWRAVSFLKALVHVLRHRLAPLRICIAFVDHLTCVRRSPPLPPPPSSSPLFCVVRGPTALYPGAPSRTSLVSPCLFLSFVMMSVQGRGRGRAASCLRARVCPPPADFHCWCFALWGRWGEGKGCHAGQRKGLSVFLASWSPRSCWPFPPIDLLVVCVCVGCVVWARWLAMAMRLALVGGFRPSCLLSKTYARLGGVGRVVRYQPACAAGCACV